MKKFILLYKNSGDNNKYRAKNIINSFFNTYSSFDLHGIKTSQVKEFANLGIMILNSNVVRNNSIPWNTAFFCYLAKDEKTFIEALKKIPDNKRRFYSGNWRNGFNNFKRFCMYNDLKTRKEITGFLNSSLIKELFRNKQNDLKNIKKNVLRDFVK